MNKNRLVLGTCSARSVFGLHCQVWKMDEAMCSVDDHTVVSHEMLLYFGYCQSIHYDGLLCKIVIFNIKFKCGCCNRFL